MCTSWTGRVRREERRARMREENNAHTHSLLFHSWPTGTTAQDYLLSLTSYSLTLSLKEAHIRPDSPTNTLTHTQLRERRMRGIIQTFAHAHALAHSLRHTHTRTNQTLLNVCFLEKEPAGLSTCFSALKSARVSDELWQKSGREGARAASRPKSQQVATWLANARQEVHRRCSHRRHAADP